MKQHAWIALAVVALVAATSGCRGDATGGGATATPTASGGSIRVRSARDLPPVSDYLPPIDDGRLEVPPPEGWVVLPRGGRTLTTIVLARNSQFPRITIDAQDPPSGLSDDLTKSNVQALATWVDQDLQKRQRQVWENGLPIQLEKNVFVRHVRRAEDSSGTPLVIQSLQTVQGGRLYTVELIVMVDAPRPEQYEESLKRYRDHAYAVAAGMRFAPPGQTFDPLATVGSGEASNAEPSTAGDSTEESGARGEAPSPEPETDMPPATADAPPTAP